MSTCGSYDTQWAALILFIQLCRVVADTESDVTLASYVQNTSLFKLFLVSTMGALVHIVSMGIRAVRARRAAYLSGPLLRSGMIRGCCYELSFVLIVNVSFVQLDSSDTVREAAGAPMAVAFLIMVAEFIQRMATPSPAELEATQPRPSLLVR